MFRKKGENLWNLGLDVLRSDIKSVIHTRETWLKDFIRIKTCASPGTMLRGWKDKLQTRRKYPQNMYPTKNIYLEYIKKTSNLNSLKKSPNGKWEKGMTFYKEDIQMVNKHMKRCSISLTIREM